MARSMYSGGEIKKDRRTINKTWYFGEAGDWADWKSGACSKNGQNIWDISRLLEIVIAEADRGARR